MKHVKKFILRTNRWSEHHSYYFFPLKISKPKARLTWRGNSCANPDGAWVTDARTEYLPFAENIWGRRYYGMDEYDVAASRMWITHAKAHSCGDHFYLMQRVQKTTTFPNTDSPLLICSVVVTFWLWIRRLGFYPQIQGETQPRRIAKLWRILPWRDDSAWIGGIRYHRRWLELLPWQRCCCIYGIHILVQ